MQLSYGVTKLLFVFNKVGLRIFELFKPCATYSCVNKPVMGTVIGGLALFGMVLFVAAFRNGLARVGTEELVLGIVGLGFLLLSLYVIRFISSPRVLIEKDYFLVSDFYRKRKLAYQEVLALAQFVRSMPMRHNRNRSLMVPVLAIRLRSGKLIQIALPNSQNNRACLDALSNASGLSIASLGVDPSKVNEWPQHA